MSKYVKITMNHDPTDMWDDYKNVGNWEILHVDINGGSDDHFNTNAQGLDRKLKFKRNFDIFIENASLTLIQGKSWQKMRFSTNNCHIWCLDVVFMLRKRAQSIPRIKLRRKSWFSLEKIEFFRFSIFSWQYSQGKGRLLGVIVKNFFSKNDPITPNFMRGIDCAHF